jgi:hypothetical protein
MIEYKYEKEIGVDPNEYFWHSMPNDKRQQMWDSLDIP